MGWIWQGLRESRNTIQEMKKSDTVLFTDKDGYIRKGSVRFREIYCNKPGCTKCPHKIYAYARYRDGEKVKEKYLGIIDQYKNGQERW